MEGIFVDGLVLGGQTRTSGHAEAAIQEAHGGRANGGRTRRGRW